MRDSLAEMFPKEVKPVLKAEFIPEEVISKAELSLIKYPFKRANLTYRSVSHGTYGKPSGQLQFSNGGTSGQQQFEGETMMDVIMKQDVFLANINE